MGLANKILPHYTYNDYIHWEGRWELIEGHPIAMSPSPAPKHQRIASALNALFFNALRKSKCEQCHVYEPLDYKVSEDTILQPDLLIVYEEVTKQYLDFPPALIIEILSPSTALRDRHTKFEIYQNEGVKYYLIADPANETIEIYSLINGYQLQPHDNNPAFIFTLQNNCVINIDFSDVWS